MYIFERKLANDNNRKHSDNNINCVLSISNYIDVVGRQSNKLHTEWQQTGIEIITVIYQLITFPNKRRSPVSILWAPCCLAKRIKK